MPDNNVSLLQLVVATHIMYKMSTELLTKSTDITLSPTGDAPPELLQAFQIIVETATNKLFANQPQIELVEEMFDEMLEHRAKDKSNV